MIKINRIEYDNTPLEPQVIGICWYTPETYGPCLAVFDDRNSLHQSYEDWLRFAVDVEQKLTERGIGVIRVAMDPDTFVEWCRENGFEVIDRKARTVYSGVIALESINEERQ